MHSLLLTALLIFSHLSSPSHALNQEGLYLLDAKRGLDDPSDTLADWNPRDPTPCNWTAVTCSSSTVTALDFTNFGLAGAFPSSLCRLPSLSFLSLSFNYINSSLLDSSLLPCPSLTHLDLSQNLLVGPLPSSLSTLPFLSYLDLSFNNFSGPIPPSFALFPRLKALTLVDNFLNSTVPSFLSNVSSLQQLNLSYNAFSPAPIPSSFGNLSSLQVLWLAGCHLVGPIPDSLGRLSSLTNLDLSSNFLTGSIPESLTSLSSIVQIELFNNSLSGPIPTGFSGLTSLLRFDASMNQLEGPLPDDLFGAPNLESLHLYQNRITGDVPAAISRSTRLVEVTLFQNLLTGSLPPDLGKNSPLRSVDFSENNLSGEIPSSICDRRVLERILLIGNSFNGAIPAGLGSCRTLTRIRLSKNRLSGNVPSGMWGLPHVWLLDLAGNSLSGQISPAIVGASNLSQLLISDNGFTGSIPSEMGSLPKLYEFSASNNRLTGPIPASFADLTTLGQLDLHNNSLSGELPTGIESWKRLTELNLADNDLTGEIPAELGGLPVLNYLDLSSNILTGEIPVQLQNLKLIQFNLSDNQLSGPIPPLYAMKAYRTSFLDNPGLCSDMAGLCPSSRKGSRNDSHLAWLFRSIFVLAAFVLFIGVGWFYWRYRSFKKAKLGSDKSKWTLTSFHKLGFSEYEILDCLDEDHVIGCGASGKVYKAELSSGEFVAVKKLWGLSKNMDEDNAFEAEVATLGKIRHKNIVRLWCSCSHKDCKLLVYEYMPNGSLGDLLHSSKGSVLDWPKRLKIALDAAEGLAYLHHDCVPLIVHRDVKSNNILLDGEFGAKVADFGVAKTVEAIGKGSKSMSVIAGSCGYIAPEYAYTLRVNEKSDIYSFGVVILELVTGKLPIDPEFGEKDLVKWVCSTVEQKGLDHVLDPNLDISHVREEICKVFNIGLLCTSNLPMNRPSMRRVVKMLLEVSSTTDMQPKTKRQQDGTLSPYYYEDYSEQGSSVC